MSQTATRSRLNQWIVWLLVPAAIFVFFLGQHRAAPEFNVTNVSVQEAKALIDSGAKVIDVREPEKFEHRHIPGALLIPLAVLRAGIPAPLAGAKDEPIVVYCGDGVTIGPEGTAILNRAGFARAVNVGPGIQGWANAGLPVAHGRQ